MSDRSPPPTPRRGKKLLNWAWTHKAFRGKKSEKKNPVPRPTHSPYDLGKIGPKEYPGE